MNIDLISSLIVYYTLALFLFVCAWYSCKHDMRGSRNHSYFPLILGIFVFALISGFRYNVGSDCESYAQTYLYLLERKKMPSWSLIAHSEVGFLQVTNLFAKLGMPRFIYMGFWAFLDLLFISIALKNRKFLLPFFGLILLTGPYYWFWMNGIRQAFVSCVMVFGVARLVDKKDVITYLGLIAICMLFHKSVIVLVPFVLLVFYNRIPNKYFALTLIVLSVVFGHFHFWQEELAKAGFLVKIFGYESYGDNLDNFVDAGSLITHFGPRRIVLLLSELIVVLFSTNIARQRPFDRFYRVSFLFFMINSIASEALIGADIVFLRPFAYAKPFSLICEAYTLSYLLEMISYRSKFSKYSMLPVLQKQVVFVISLLVFSCYVSVSLIASQDAVDASSVFYKLYFTV